LATPTAWVIVRVLVESPEDLSTAQSLQRSVRVTAPLKHPQVLTERSGRPTALREAGVGFFRELAACLALDPPAPWHPPLSAPALDLVTRAEAASASTLLAGIEEGEALLADGNSADALVANGWRTGRSAGGPGQDILKRALGAKFGLGGHYALENRSYTALHDAEGQPLHGARTLTLRFEAGSLPPCDAFWSLTAYGTDLYLVENEIDRWSLGDRTPGLRYCSDGSLTITLAAERPPQIANWLPVPPAPYLLGLRVYEGHDEVVHCRWFPPPLRRVSER